MIEFWVLGRPDSPGSDRRLVDWPADEELHYEKVDCTVDPDGHRGVRDRITTPLSAVLPHIELQDFLWTHLGECLVQQHVLELFSNSGFAGYEAIRAKARFKNSQRRPPELWELAIRGSAGSGSPESGLRILRKCPGCGLTDYSAVTDPSKFVDKSKWDGSDFFRVRPVTGWIFVTDRVVQALQASTFTGWQAKSPGDMKESFDIALGTD